MHPRERRDLALLALVISAAASAAVAFARPESMPAPTWAEGPPPEPGWLKDDSTSASWQPRWTTPVSEPTVELPDSLRAWQSLETLLETSENGSGMEWKPVPAR